MDNVLEPNSIIVSYDTKLEKFTLFNKSRQLIGEITAEGLIKHIAQSLSLTFLENVVLTQVYSIYICKIAIIGNEIKITLLNHNESPFMGNVEMLMKLYKIIHKFESEKLYDELQKTKEKNGNKIIAIIKQLSYLLLNYTLKLIAVISDAIKNDDSKKVLKDMLLKYSVVCVYNMTNFMKSKIEEKISDFNQIQSDVVRMGKIKLEMYKKIDELTKSVNAQTAQLSSITKKISDSRGCELVGGGSDQLNSENHSTTANTSTTSVNKLSSSSTTSSNPVNSGTSQSTNYSTSQSGGQNKYTSNDSDEILIQKTKSISKSSGSTSDISNKSSNKSSSNKSSSSTHQKDSDSKSSESSSVEVEIVNDTSSVTNESDSEKSEKEEASSSNSEKSEEEVEVSEVIEEGQYGGFNDSDYYFTNTDSDVKSVSNIKYLSSPI